MNRKNSHGHECLLNEEFKQAIQEVVDKFKEEYDCDLVAVCAFSLKDGKEKYTQVFDAQTVSDGKVLDTLGRTASARLLDWCRADVYNLEIKKYKDSSV